MLDAELKLKLFVANRPWEKEPSYEQWVDEGTGLSCRIRRHPNFLHLCGYVGVGEGHPLFGATEDTLDVSVHGGLTYGGQENDGLYWFGFDCAHAGDLSPGILTTLIGAGRDDLRYYLNEEYCTWEYVKNQVQELAEQLWRANKC